jgi:chromosome segregation ATPase
MNSKGVVLGLGNGLGCGLMGGFDSNPLYKMNVDLLYKNKVLESKLVDKDKEIKELQGQIAIQQVKLGKFMKENEMMRIQFKKNTIALKKLQEQQPQDDMIRELRLEMANKNASILGYEKGNKNLRSQNEQLQMRNVELENHVQKLSEKTTKKIQEFQEFEKKTTEFYKSQHDQWASKYNEIREHYLKAIDEYQKTSKKNEELVKENTILHKDHVKMSRNIRDLTKQLKLKDEIKSKSRFLLEMEVEAQRMMIGDKKKLIKELQEKIRFLENKNNQRVQELDEQIAKLQSQRVSRSNKRKIEQLQNQIKKVKCN